MRKYRVYGTWDAEWVVEAEDADAAEQAVNDGEAGDAEITGYSVDNVVMDGEPYDAPDEREACTCGHILSIHYGSEFWKNGEWHPKSCTRYGCECQAPIPTSTDNAEEGETDG